MILLGFWLCRGGVHDGIGQAEIIAKLVALGGTVLDPGSPRFNSPCVLGPARTQPIIVWVFALFFRLAREGQPKKQSNNPNLDPANHRFTPGIICIGVGLGSPLVGPGPSNNKEKAEQACESTPSVICRDKGQSRVQLPLPAFWRPGNTHKEKARHTAVPACENTPSVICRDEGRGSVPPPAFRRRGKDRKRKTTTEKRNQRTNTFPR